MSRERLQRVKAVKGWLDKAESSYTKGKDFFGEFNLIMAQAEMQRLKESGNASLFFRRCLQMGALLSAFLIVGGGYSLYINSESREQARQEAMKKQDAQTEMAAAEMTRAVSLGVRKGDVPDLASKDIAVKASEFVIPTAQETSVPSALGEHMISQQEIQSAVGEAGRILRGQ